MVEVLAQSAYMPDSSLRGRSGWFASGTHFAGVSVTSAPPRRPVEQARPENWSEFASQSDGVD